ncbi:acetyl-CoA carboxylase biotin carboxyl carrier protein [Leptotrichia sp. OH3620_COT-345]|uniref:acetyl-CoA carboxylase biotin carboxyl carrier protein n=1 Tax=Leptotrichia sp. OH3620_COT-345 TaxID=2491048 RepID=UPI000F647DAD|nr:acetyl-CoA carboxylase biotin carboxyl carrier protein [Leptotrichia sp. OH3620_COT-345]RRD39942.1 acetyl-CoA carboxylase biotin carboxyl carrier protein [Leptotrichia sp. OH3620_COT-345]
MKEKIKFIKELAKSMNENKLDSLQYEENNFEIQLRKREKEKRTVFYGGAPVNIQSGGSNAAVQETISENTVPVAQLTEAIEEVSGIKIESPMVGTFYIAPSPTSAPFIKEGDNVSEGQTLCIVEAMKLMNEVKSSVSGKIKKIMVKDGEAIKKGQTLVIIE